VQIHIGVTAAKSPPKENLMMKSHLCAGLLALSCGLACTSHSQASAAAEVQSSSQPDTNVSRRSSSTPEVKLLASGETKYPSPSTQMVTFTVGNLDESKGVAVTSGSGCEVKGNPEKTGAGAYKVSVSIPSRAEDGDCSLSVASTATGAMASVEVSYTADPEYWKNAAPDLYAFANSKTWTFKTNTGKTQTFQVTHIENSGERITAMASGPDDANSVFGFSLPDKVAGTFGQCVLQGTLSKDTAILKPIMQIDLCKEVQTLTVKASH
jgi:hypothetical protein